MKGKQIMETIRPRVRVAGILIENDEILLIEHTKNDKKYKIISKYKRTDNTIIK